MVYSLTYRRPARVPSARDSLSGADKQSSINESIASGESCMSAGIPEPLSFDRIVSGATCPPCTIRDFLNYLKYIEFSAENLQFYLWLKDFTARFESLPDSEKVLSPEWTMAQAEAEAAAAGTTTTKPGLRTQFAEVLKNTDFDDSKPKMMSDRANPFDTPNKSRSLDEMYETHSEQGSTVADKSSTAHKAVAQHAFEDAGMQWQPFTAQPYRDEVNRIISIYLAEGGSRELNLSSREKQTVLHALQNTTHPSAFGIVATSVEYSLRRQAHPNFIRWTICNGNRPRVVFARGLGIGGIVAGLVADLLITLSGAGRAWRVLPFLGWFIGIATLIAAWKGMCVVLHGMHHRHLRPWELFAGEGDEVLDEKGATSHDSLLSASTNSYEDEPWVPVYRRRNVIRKIFDREIWIQEPALRQIQDTIFLQALLGAFVLSCVAVGIFCAVPKGGFY